MTSTLSAEDFYQRLADMSTEDRLLELHRALRNIPREFLIEYMAVPEDKMDTIGNWGDTSHE